MESRIQFACTVGELRKRPPFTIRIRNIPYETTRPDFDAFLTELGITPDSAHVALHPTRPGLCRGVAYVNFFTRETRDAALKRLAGVRLHGRPLNLAALDSSTHDARGRP
jgi:RNA recognition motif-containing protein